MFALSRLTARRCSTFLFPMFSLNPSVLSCFFGKTGSPSRYLRDDIKDQLPKLPWDLLGPDVNRAYLRKRMLTDSKSHITMGLHGPTSNDWQQLSLVKTS